MNFLEKKMVDTLIDLRENHNVIGVKAEFEAEGTRMEEALRLKEVITRAGLDLTIKIGGCEAIKDMYEAKVIGVSKIVAPMIESDYALKKFMLATKLAFDEEERKEVGFFINIETIQAYQNLDCILNAAEKLGLDGIVLGRGDFSESLGMTRDDINKPEIFEKAQDILVKSKKLGLKNGVGGGVSADSIPFFKSLPSGVVDFYETRKVIFKCPEAISENGTAGILKAVGFELMWLKNKQNYYGDIYKEDIVRINVLESRYKKSIEAVGGKYE